MKPGRSGSAAQLVTQPVVFLQPGEVYLEVLAGRLLVCVRQAKLAEVVPLPGRERSTIDTLSSSLREAAATLSPRCTTEKVPA